MMTDAPAPPSTGGRRNRSWLPGVVAAIVVVLVLVATVAVVVARNNDSSPSNAGASVPQLASIRSVCNDWQHRYSASSMPPSKWCNTMIGWMESHLASGQMQGSMMWSNPVQMRQTCQMWMATRADNANATTWCTSMVDWMTEHRGNWDRWDQGWMMNGSSMMGSG